MTNTDEQLIYHGGAKPGDQSFADIVAVDSDIIAYLAGAPVGFTNTGFLRAIAGQLSAEPSDAEVRQAIDAAV